jgi:peptidoglycan hydrolase CwlO-like protein
MLKNALFALAALLALVLSASIVFQTVGNSKLQQAGQAKDAEIQAIQTEIQSLQQQLQTQQKQIESANQLANQAGPAILSELATLQVKNNNMALGVFLQKHGVQVRDTAPQSSTPQPPKPTKGLN